MGTYWVQYTTCSQSCWSIAYIGNLFKFSTVTMLTIFYSFSFSSYFIYLYTSVKQYYSKIIRRHPSKYRYKFDIHVQQFFGEKWYCYLRIWYLLRGPISRFNTKLAIVTVRDYDTLITITLGVSGVIVEKICDISIYEPHISESLRAGWACS